VATLEALDDDHVATAAGARRAMVVSLVVLVALGEFGRRHGEQLAGAGEVGLAGGAGEQAVVADAVKAFRQDVSNCSRGWREVRLG
jgi:hypothetical protein